MALIQCPECGGSVSDRAPTCPHCGFPLAAPEPAPIAAAAPGADDGPAATAPTRPPIELVEPWRPRLAGRRIPIAMLLFWGGMVVGMILKFWAPPVVEGAEPEPWRIIPWAMIWIGVLWFAINEFIAIMRNRARRRRAG